jgi:hypothetical protein
VLVDARRAALRRRHHAHRRDRVPVRRIHTAVDANDVRVAVIFRVECPASARDRDGAVTVTCECTRGRRCAMRACRCTMQAIARRYSTSCGASAAPRRLSPRGSMAPGASIHTCTRTIPHTDASSREHR